MISPSPTEAAKFYQRTTKIHGWFSEYAANTIYLIDAIQKEENIVGNIFEIGVHHGKSSVFFAGLLRSQEMLAVCDIFGSQVDNVSASGDGDERIFSDNIVRYLDKSRLQINRKLSDTLTENDIPRPIRLFHVDGGHNRNEALSDLEMAHSNLAKGGVIIVDDPFRVEWPGVTEAIIDFLRGETKMHAFLSGHNKIYIVEDSYYIKYKKMLNDGNLLEKFGLGFPFSLKSAAFCNKIMYIQYLKSSRDGVPGIKQVGKLVKHFPILKKIRKNISSKR